MTTKLYYESAYLQEWLTTVTAVTEGDGGHYVELAATAFYPHGGGQPCDSGMINGIPVLDVSLEGERIVHKLERPLAAGERVDCRLDWDRRFDHMQQHSGQHLLSAVCRDVVQAMTVSFHLGQDYCTIDVDQPTLSPGQLAAVEAEVNRHIYLNHPIESYFVTDEEAAALPLVKALQVSENIRIVETKDVEYNACGGTHVSATGAIGMIKVLKADKQKGNTRIFFKCGLRALEEANAQARILAELSARFNTNREDLSARLDKQEQDLKQLQTEVEALRGKQDEYLIQELLSQTAVDKGRFIAHSFPDKPLKDLQPLAVKLSERSGLPVLLLTAIDNKTVLAGPAGTAFSCGAFFKSHLAAYEGKGGGSGQMAQAGFSNWDNARAFYEFAKGPEGLGSIE